MKALLIAVAAGAFALTAGAQTAAPSTDKATVNKAKQEQVQSATKDVGGTVRSGEAADKAAMGKGTPKALPDKAAKQAAVKGTTESTAGTGFTQSAGAAANKAAADKSPRKEKPKMSEHEKELQKAAKP